MNRTITTLQFRKLPFKDMVALSAIACYGFMSQTESARKIAEFTGVSIKTARRWLVGDKVPLSVVKLFEMTYTSGIPQDGVWKGYFINRDEELVSPEGYVLTPTHVQRMYIDKWRRESQDATIRRLKQEVKELKEFGSDDKRQEIIGLANQMLKIANQAPILKAVQ